MSDPKDAAMLKQVKEAFSVKTDDACAEKLLTLHKQTKEPLERLAEAYDAFSINEKLKEMTLASVEKFILRRKMQKNVAKKKSDGGMMRSSAPAQAAAAGAGNLDFLSRYGAKMAKNKTPSKPPASHPNASPPARMQPSCGPTPAKQITGLPAKTPKLPKFGGSSKPASIVAPVNPHIPFRGGGSIDINSMSFGFDDDGIWEVGQKMKQERIQKIKNGEKVPEKPNPPFRYMMMDFDQIRHNQNERIFNLGKLMKKKIEASLSDGKMETDQPEEASNEANEAGLILDGFYQHVGVASQSAGYFLGRIITSSGLAGQDDDMILMLEGETKISHGAKVKLDLSMLPSYAVFPGQVIVVKGTNTSGRELVAQQIFDDFTTPMEEYEEATLKTMWTDNKPIQVIFAAGPFTAPDNLDYYNSPLQKLACKIKQMKPSAVHLMGPLVDERNEYANSCKMELTYEEAAKVLMGAFCADLKRANLSTQILTSPSTQDLCHEPVFPCHQYYDSLGFEAAYPNLLNLPNPVQYSIHDFRFAVSTGDALRSLNASEIRKSTARGRGDWSKRGYQHVVNQSSFFPALIGFGAFLDPTFHHDLHFDETPDIMVGWSKLKNVAAKLDNGTIALNPKSVYNGRGGGTYGVVTIAPPNGKPRHERVRVDVKKI